MKINPKSYEAYKLLHDGILAFSRAEQQGIRVDIDYVIEKKAWVTRRMDKLENAFKETNTYKHWAHAVKGKININSGTQLSHFLYNIKKIDPTKFTTTGKGATDEEALRQLDMPELNLLLDRTRYKKAWDVLNGFEKEQVNGFVHPFFNLHMVRTFRSSSDSPNFQNIPKRDEEIMQICRKALVPRPGRQFVEIDFSGLEVRIAACYHKDETMIKYIENPKSDMHGDMAKEIFIIDKFDKTKHNVLRQAAKNGFVFAEFYGDYYGNCAKGIASKWVKLPDGEWSATDGIEIDGEPLGAHMIKKGIKSLKQFTEHIRIIEKDFWENRFPQYARWKDNWWELYQKYGHIDMFTGFRCSGVMKRNDCINYPVQGAAFHCNLWTFIELDRLMRSENWDTKLIGQIHDSIIMDVHPNELDHVIATAKRVTGTDLRNAWKWINVPLDIDIEIAPVDASWAEKEKFK
jgi:DNA polymerase-1